MSITITQLELVDAQDTARHVEIEANRLAKAFAFCSPENQPEDCGTAPIWDTIRDLRRLAAAIREGAQA
jgi:hypothetical protein